MACTTRGKSDDDAFALLSITSMPGTLRQKTDDHAEADPSIPRPPQSRLRQSRSRSRSRRRRRQPFRRQCSTSRGYGSASNLTSLPVIPSPMIRMVHSTGDLLQPRQTSAVPGPRIPVDVRWSSNRVDLIINRTLARR